MRKFIHLTEDIHGVSLEGRLFQSLGPHTAIENLRMLVREKSTRYLFPLFRV